MFVQQKALLPQPASARQPPQRQPPARDSPKSVCRVWWHQLAKESRESLWMAIVGLTDMLFQQHLDHDQYVSMATSLEVEVRTTQPHPAPRLHLCPPTASRGGWGAGQTNGRSE